MSESMRERAARGPLDVDISDFSDEFCAGFLAGQVNMVDVAERARGFPVVHAIFDMPPQVKQRPRVGQGRAFTPAATSAAEEAIRWQLKSMSVKPVSSPVEVDLAFYVPDRRRRDMDNLEKLVLDACNGFALADDSQVIEKHTHLYRGERNPRTVLRIWERP